MIDKSHNEDHPAGDEERGEITPQLYRDQIQAAYELMGMLTDEEYEEALANAPKKG